VHPPKEPPPSPGKADEDDPGESEDLNARASGPGTAAGAGTRAGGGGRAGGGTLRAGGLAVDPRPPWPKAPWYPDTSPKATARPPVSVSGYLQHA